MKEEKFDFEAYKKEAIRKLLNKEPGMSIDQLTKPLLKQILEAALEGEMESHMESERDIGNRKNGKLRKTVKSRDGAFELETPRDRHGTFDPKMVENPQLLQVCIE